MQRWDREAWLWHSYKSSSYFELDRERPFFDALGDFHTHIAKCEEHMTTALSEVSKPSSSLVPRHMFVVRQVPCACQHVHQPSAVCPGSMSSYNPCALAVSRIAVKAS